MEARPLRALPLEIEHPLQSSAGRRHTESPLSRRRHTEAPSRRNNSSSGDQAVVSAADTWNGDQRQTRSWAAGSQRREVLQPLRPVGAVSFAPDQTWNASNTFGGINTQARTIRPTLPSMRQRTHFASFVAEHKARCRDKIRIVALVNSKSGGQVGSLLMKTLRENLGDLEDKKKVFGEVCDLSLEDEPESTIRSLALQARMGRAGETRLLVCGGDGTVTWILTALEQCPEMHPYLDQFPVAIVPLGTGNDLARSLGWGPRLREVADILLFLEWLLEARPCIMDQWRVVLRPHEKLDDTHKLKTCGSHPQLVRDQELAVQLLGDLHEALNATEGSSGEVFVGYWQNYYSVGLDALITAKVEHARSRTDCGKAAFRNGCGKICYPLQAALQFGAALTMNITRDLSSLKVAQLEDESMTQDAAESAPMAVFGMLNINSYGAGTQCLPKQLYNGKRPSAGDGLMEVFAFRNLLGVATQFLRINRPRYVTSAEAVVFSLRAGHYMQTDGEGWRLPSGCDVLVEPHRKVKMLCAPDKAKYWTGHVKPSFWLDGDHAYEPPAF